MQKLVIMEQIKKSTIDFLSDLKRNNYRDWFLDNRQRYEDARLNFESFVQDVIDEIALFDPIIKGLGVKSCTYRINRDIRFSNDKTVYKSHLGAYIVRGGKKNGDKFAGYYLHIEPGNSMIAGGAYLPPAPWLTAIREKIDEDGEKLVRIINQKDFKSYFGEIEGDKVKTSPKGYSKDHPYIELLRFKSFLAAKLISDKDVLSTNFFDHVMSAVRVLKPLNDFMNDY
jgi:uncharacterized protein (TIGR02453 family)